MYATHLRPAERFWFNAQVRTATDLFKKEQKEQAMDNQQSAGAGSPQQQREMHERQENRAKTRESMQEAGMQAPSPEGQNQKLQEFRQHEDEAESFLQASDGEDGGDQ